MTALKLSVESGSRVLPGDELFIVSMREIALNYRISQQIQLLLLAQSSFLYTYYSDIIMNDSPCSRAVRVFSSVSISPTSRLRS